MGVEQFDDFWAHRPSGQFFYTPTRALWPSKSVDAALPRVPLVDANGHPVINKKTREPKTVGASVVIAKKRAVQSTSWMPVSGGDEIIRDLLFNEGGCFKHPGAKCFNMYLPPPAIKGNPKQIKPWLAHLGTLYPDNVDHIVPWLAHRVQFPAIKINHALVMGGSQGVGKDSILEPIKHAIGGSNFQEVSPSAVMGRFNGFLKSVILRVSEGRDLGEIDRYSFYEHMKTYIAEPPDVLRVDEKFLREYYIPNCTSVIILTNYKAGGIYLPSDDRRHHVSWTDLTEKDFTKEYFLKLYHWYRVEGGNQNVAAYLASLDLSKFNPKAPPPKTRAWWDIVDSNRAPEQSELADLLDQMGNPPAITLEKLIEEFGEYDVAADNAFYNWITDRRNRRVIPHRLEQVGYVPVRNEGHADGLWVIRKRRCRVYAKRELPLSDQLNAVAKMRRDDEAHGKQEAAGTKWNNGPLRKPSRL
jgi:Family of unknown function (DUF5906)